MTSKHLLALVAAAEDVVALRPCEDPDCHKSCSVCRLVLALRKYKRVAKARDPSAVSAKP